MKIQTQLKTLRQKVLEMRDLQVGGSGIPVIDFCLEAGEFGGLFLPDEEVACLERALMGFGGGAVGQLKILGVVVDGPEVWEERLRGRVSRTFCPLFGQACWMENLNVDENILLPSLMDGESLNRVRQRASELAKELGLPELPTTRRGDTSPSVLSVCQWIRALLHESAELFLMVDPLRGVTRGQAMLLGEVCRRKARTGSAFFWLLPSSFNQGWVRELTGGKVPSTFPHDIVRADSECADP